MFWKIVRWGGSAVLVLVAVLAVVSSVNEEVGKPVAPEQTVPATSGSSFG